MGVMSNGTGQQGQSAALNSGMSNCHEGVGLSCTGPQYGHERLASSSTLRRSESAPVSVAYLECCMGG